MSKENKSKYVVLGILSYGPASGYDIKNWIKNGVGYFWNISYNQIYPTLKKFIQDGLATSITERQDGRPERKVYTLTEKGRETLKNWLYQPINHNNPNGNELLLKLMLGSQITVDANIEHLTRYKNHKSRLLDELRTLEIKINTEESLDPSRPYRLAALMEGILINESLIKWCDQTISQLNALSAK